MLKIKKVFLFLLIPIMSFAGTFTVSNTNDDGVGSLREAIINANTNPGADIINFSVSGTITLVTELPSITNDNTTIDASSQWQGVWPAGSPGIIIDGTNLDATRKGIYINADNCVVSGLKIINFLDDENYGIFVWGDYNTIGGSSEGMRNVIVSNKQGIYIYQGNHNSVIGNYVGVDSDGTTDLGNQGYGVGISSASYYNQIGGANSGEGNVISGNGSFGLTISGQNTDVMNNLIGTDKNGTAAVPNDGSGIRIFNGSSNNIGGAESGKRNIISGNKEYGIEISGNLSYSNIISGNYIGTDLNGTADLGNIMDGIILYNNSHGNTIGGTAAGAGNVISGNVDGIYIWNSYSNNVQGNFIGTDKNGTADLGNSNSGVYIDFDAYGNVIGGLTNGSRNIISGNDHSGVMIYRGHQNFVQGNYIGTNINGNAKLANTNYGVILYGGANRNTVGGTDSGAGNVISGNGTAEGAYGAAGVGVRGLNTNNNLIQGNYIGTTADGISDLGNAQFGVFIAEGAQSNTIGGSSSSARNIISGNSWSGVNLEDAGTNNNVVCGNYIGINKNGAYRRNDSNGIYVRDGAANTIIGGDTENERNVISCNDAYGIKIGGASGEADASGTIIKNNYVGTDTTGEINKGNSYGGVRIQVESSNTTVINNLVSGNSGSGISITDGANTIKGNIIGSDKDKETAIPNTSDGISIDSDGNTIGGTSEGDGNFVGFNGGNGVEINLSNNILYGNTICNNDDDGVYIAGYNEHADNNVIGGTTPGQANTIYENGINGVHVYGVDESGEGGYDFRYTDYNKISGNSIYNNTSKGIELEGSGNGAGTLPSISAPIVNTATLNGTTLSIDGTDAGNESSVEIFKADNGTSGEGKIYLGSLTADVSGNFSGNLDVTDKGLTAGDDIVATTTHTDNNSSEFSTVIVVTEAGTIISAQSGNWEDGTTWEGGTVPTAADNAIVYESHTVTVNDSRQSNLLSIKQNGTLQLNADLPTASSYDFDSLSTVEYSLAGNQSISSTPFYGNLIINGSGTKTALGSLDINGTLTVSESPVYSTNFSTNINGNFIIQNDAQVSLNGDAVINGSFTQSENSTFQNNAQLTVSGNLSLSDNSIFTQAHNVNINGNLTINDGTTLNGGVFDINLAGDWTNNGTWNYNTSTVIFDEPASDQIIGPSSSGTEIQIGTGTNTYWSYPFENSRDNSRTQMLYLGSEIGQTGNINGIQFYVTQFPEAEYRSFANFTVKLKETTDSDWSSQSNYVDMTGATVVLSQNPYSMPAATGWFTINFTTPFSYGGSNNLIVEIIWGDNGAHTWSDYYEVYQTGRNYECVIYGSDNSQTPPAYDGTQDDLPNIKFNFQGAGSKEFYNLTISTAGSPGTTTSQADLHIHNNLVIDSGSELVVGQNELTVDGTITYNGPVSCTKTESPTNGVSTTFTADGMDLVQITPSSGNMGSTEVIVKYGTFCSANAFGSGCTETPQSIKRYYNITPLTAQTANIRFCYLSGELNGQTHGEEMKAFHWNSTSSQWEEIGTYVGHGGTGTKADPYYVEFSNISSYSPFVLSSQDSPLPVELVSFEGTATEDGVLLEWETATEVNNYGFDVERRSSLLEEWQKLGFVQGNGTTNSPKSYSFTDTLNLDLNPNPNLTQVDYRLKQIDNDGTFAYSKVITVDLTSITSVDDEVVYKFALQQNYPNPFNPTTTIKFTIPSVGDAKFASPTTTKLVVYDILGREVETLVNQRLQPGNYEVNFDASNLSSGIYFYRINVGNKYQSVKKMMLIK